jgi:hypothetical protein
MARPIATISYGRKSLRTSFSAYSPAAMLVTSTTLHRDPPARRRHLIESQRSVVAAKLANLKNGQRADRVQGLPIGRASELLNVSERSAHRAREVINAGAPNVVKARDQSVGRSVGSAPRFTASSKN